MTPLSVHQRGGGRTSVRPCDPARAESSDRMYWLEATPPATTRCLYNVTEVTLISPGVSELFHTLRLTLFAPHLMDGSISLAQPIPRLTRSVRCVQAVRWNDAAISALVWVRLSGDEDEVVAGSPAEVWGVWDR